MKLINDTLTATVFVEILNSDDPKVIDERGGVNLELEVRLVGWFRSEWFPFVMFSKVIDSNSLNL